VDAHIHDIRHKAITDMGRKVIPFSKSAKPPGIAKSPQLFGIRISGQRILREPWKALGRGKIYPGSRRPRPLAVDECANFWPACPEFSGGCRPA